MDDLQEKMAAGEPLMQQAINAMRRYHEAKDLGGSVEEVERLRLEAESLMQAVSEYQQSALGGHAATRIEVVGLWAFDVRALAEIAEGSPGCAEGAVG